MIMTTWFTKTTALASAFAAMALITGCATTAVSPEARLAYDQTQQRLAAQPVNIISDGCVVRVEVGRDAILYPQSDATSVAMMHTVKEALTEKGLTVSRVTAPFVCGILNKEDATKIDVKRTEDSKDTLNTEYPILSSSNTFDASTNQAYLNLFQALDRDKQKQVKEAKGKSVALDMQQSDLNTLRQIEKTDKVFVSTINGSKPSFGYSMAMGITTAVATGGAAITTVQEGQSHALYLVNLKTNQIEWGKSQQFAGRIFKMPVDERLAYKGIIAPLYED